MRPLPAETVDRRHRRLEGVAAQHVKVEVWLFLGTAAVLRCRERKRLLGGHHITVVVCVQTGQLCLCSSQDDAEHAKWRTTKKKENRTGKFRQHRKKKCEETKQELWKKWIMTQKSREINKRFHREMTEKQDSAAWDKWE